MDPLLVWFREQHQAHEIFEMLPEATHDQLFQVLKHKWHEETLLMSMAADIQDSPCYLAVIAIGKPMIPCILRELERGGSWFWCHALRVLAEEEPDVDWLKEDVKTAWLRWGRKNGYLQPERTW